MTRNLERLHLPLFSFRKHQLDDVRLMSSASRSLHNVLPFSTSQIYSEPLAKIIELDKISNFSRLALCPLSRFSAAQARKDKHTPYRTFATRSGSKRSSLFGSRGFITHSRPSPLRNAFMRNQPKRTRFSAARVLPHSRPSLLVSLLTQHRDATPKTRVSSEVMKKEKTENREQREQESGSETATDAEHRTTGAQEAQGTRASMRETRSRSKCR